MKGNVAAVYCEIKYSGVGAALLASAMLATLAVVAATPLSAALRAAFCLGIAALGCRASRSLREVRAVRLDGMGAIEVRFRDGHAAQGSVRDGSFVAPWLTLVRWRPQGARIDRTLLVLPDMLRTDDFRKLRVLLRWG